MGRRVISLLSALCVALAAFAGTALTASADTVGGTVVNIDAGSKLYVRSEPDTSKNNVIDKLSNSDKVTVLEFVTANGKEWYRVTTKAGVTGYCSAEYVALDVTYQTDEEFEAYLSLQGFPEDYKPALRKLHAAYPTWIFKADKLSMTFDKAVSEESVVGRNTIRSPDAWKSMEKGAYDWDKKEYVAFDSGGWVSTTRDVVAYYMDPRNFLNETYIFQYEDLTYSDAHTVAGVKAILPAVLADIAQLLLDAGKKNDVSAYFLATKIVQEGTVTNKLALGQVPGYEGYYNYFDIGAYAHDGNSAVTNGAIYAKNHGWNTPEKCLNDSAAYLAEKYISLGQNTTFYQKYNLTNTTSGLYKHQYMTNVAGAASEGRVMYTRLSAENRACAHVFRIPVYKSMPAVVSPRPSETGNNNNFLNSITVGGCILTPTFNRYTASYAVQVGSSVEELTVAGEKSDSDATLTGGGTVKLNTGENTVKLTVKSTSGATRIYTVVITREPGGEEPSDDTPAPTITGKTYTVNADKKTVTKIEPGTETAAFLKALDVRDGTAKLVTAEGKDKTAGPVATGDILRIYSGDKLFAAYAVLIYGDVNGDGAVNSMDLRVAQKHILRVSTLTGYYLAAADSNKDGAVNSMDLRVTQKYILKVTKTLQ